MIRSDGLTAFEREASAYDAAVDDDGRIDRFCSRSEWIVSYHTAFAPQRPVEALRRDRSWAVFAENQHPALGPYLEPLENMWGFASPLVGPAGMELLEELIDGRGCVLMGLPRLHAFAAALVTRFERRYTLRALSDVTRYVASLEGGIDGFLGRRTRSFRANLRNAERRVRAADIVFEHVAPTRESVAPVYERALAIERTTWKTASGNGVDRGAMREFYANMLPKLAASGRLRVLFARDDTGDVGYLYGGILDTRFRGLQFSFDERARTLSLGNVLQLEMIRWLSREGFTSYDLGTRSAYKQRWGEIGLTTFGVVMLPRHLRSA